MSRLHIQSVLLALSLLASARGAKGFDESIFSDPDGAFLYGDRVPRDQKEYDQAVEDYSALIRRDPNFPGAFFHRGDAWTKKGEYDKAIKDYSEAIRREPKSFEPFFNRGYARAKKGEYDKAIKDFDEVIRLNPKCTEAFWTRGIAHHANGEYDQAIEDFDEAIRIGPWIDPRVFCFRGIAWRAKGDNDRAINDFNEAIRRARETVATILVSSSLNLAKGEYAYAIGNCRQAIWQCREAAAAFDLRGRAWHTKGDYDKALQDFDEAISVNAQYELAYINKAFLMATCPVEKYRDGKKAMELATKACELTAWKDYRAIATLAAGCAECGQFEEAMKWQKKVLDDTQVLKGEGEKARQRLKLYEEKKPYREERQ
jgi:tetratricopeptide (TPR) repeat protein